MKKNWQNKVVIITGSSQGIGKALAFELGRRGAIIVINGRNREKLLAAAKQLTDDGIEVFPVLGDVSSVPDCKKLVEDVLRKFGRIDALINNAGTSSFSPFGDTSIEVLHKVIEVNLLGVMNITSAVLGHVSAAKGNLFFIGSVAGVHGIGSYATYSSSKMALQALAEALRIELQGSGVKVGIAYVGFTENDEKKRFLDARGEPINVPDRKSLKKMPQKEVARKIIRMMDRGTFRRTFTILGKITVILNSLFPGLVHRILLKNYRKTGN